MRWLLVCATAAAFVTPPPRLRPLSTRRVATPRRTHPLSGKTRALQETNTNSPWHDKGDDFRKALKEFQAKVTKWVLVVAARIKLYYLKARAFARRRALTVSGTCFLQMYKNKRETVAVSLAVLVVSERESERNVVKLRRNSDDY